MVEFAGYGMPLAYADVGQGKTYISGFCLVTESESVCFVAQSQAIIMSETAWGCSMSGTWSKRSEFYCIPYRWSSFKLPI
jgi:hypothetical protein